MVEWGSVPDWVAAVGAVGALVFAYFAVRAAYRTNDQQSKQLNLLLEDRIQEQARKVVTYYRVEDDNDVQTVTYGVYNASELPVFDLLLLAYRDRMPRMLEQGLS